MWQCHAIGEGCWSWRLGDEPSEGLSARLLAVYAELKQHPLPGVLDVVPAYTEIAVHVDPMVVDVDALRARVDTVLSAQATSTPAFASEARPMCFPVVYDGEDVERVAQHTGLSMEEVIRRHSAPVYRVAMIGFLPHFPYCLGLDPQLVTPRLSSPRERISPGSVAIAGVQTGVYPQASPGGWNLLGRMDPELLTSLKPGDRIQFERVEALG